MMKKMMMEDDEEEEEEEDREHGQLGQGNARARLQRREQVCRREELSPP